MWRLRKGAKWEIVTSTILLILLKTLMSNWTERLVNRTSAVSKVNLLSIKKELRESANFQDIQIHGDLTLPSQRFPITWHHKWKCPDQKASSISGSVVTAEGSKLTFYKVVNYWTINFRTLEKALHLNATGNKKTTVWMQFCFHFLKIFS